MVVDVLLSITVVTKDIIKGIVENCMVDHTVCICSCWSRDS